MTWLFGDRLAFPESYDDVVVWLRGHGDIAWLVGVGVIMADAILPVPSTPASFAMGIIYGPVVGGLICGTALFLAAALGFGLARSLGDRGARFLVGDQDLAGTRRFYDRWGMPAIVLGRAIGGPAEWAVILAGLSQLSAGRVLAAAALGAYVSGFVVAALGAMSIQEPLLAIGAAVAFLGLLLWLGRRMSNDVEDTADASD